MGTPQQLRQLSLAHLNWLGPQVLAVQFKQIEGAVYRGCYGPMAADKIKDRNTGVFANDRLAIDQARAHRQRRDRKSDERKPTGEVVAVPAQEPDASLVEPGQNANPSCLIS